jgi:hypothetical protein
VLATAVIISMFTFFTNPFLNGTVNSVYWAYFIVQAIHLPLMVITVLIAVSSLIYVLMRHILQKPKVRFPNGYFRIFALSSFLLIFSGLITLVQSLEHLDQTYSNEQVHYLMAESALFKMRLILFECDSFGVTCHQIYSAQFEGDEMKRTARSSSLIVNPSTDELLIQAENGEIYYAVSLRQ